MNAISRMCGVVFAAAWVCVASTAVAGPITVSENAETLSPMLSGSDPNGVGSDNVITLHATPRVSMAGMERDTLSPVTVAVPEPASILLLGTGLIALAIGLRRIRHLH